MSVVDGAPAKNLPEEKVAHSARGEGHAQAITQRQRENNDRDNSNITMTNAGSTDDGEVQISAGQRMLSALSGSLLTALLGTLAFTQTSWRIECLCRIFAV